MKIKVLNFFTYEATLAFFSNKKDDILIMPNYLNSNKSDVFFLDQEKGENLAKKFGWEFFPTPLTMASWATADSNVNETFLQLQSNL